MNEDARQLELVDRECLELKGVYLDYIKKE